MWSCAIHRTHFFKRRPYRYQIAAPDRYQIRCPRSRSLDMLPHGVDLVSPHSKNHSRLVAISEWFVFLPKPLIKLNYFSMMRMGLNGAQNTRTVNLPSWPHCLFSAVCTLSVEPIVSETLPFWIATTSKRMIAGAESEMTSSSSESGMAIGSDPDMAACCST